MGTYRHGLVRDLTLTNTALASARLLSVLEL